MAMVMPGVKVGYEVLRVYESHNGGCPATLGLPECTCGKDRRIIILAIEGEVDE